MCEHLRQIEGCPSVQIKEMPRVYNAEKRVGEEEERGPEAGESSSYKAFIRPVSVSGKWKTCAPRGANSRAAQSKSSVSEAETNRAFCPLFRYFWQTKYAFAAPLGRP